MPIFAYRCNACGFEKDVLQKRADPPLDTCPSCSTAAFQRVLTAPAFQLKGSGWYVTDFRDNGKSKSGAEAPDKADKTDKTDKTDSPAAAATGAAAAASPSAPAPSPAPAPAPAAAQPAAGA